MTTELTHENMSYPELVSFLKETNPENSSIKEWENHYLLLSKFDNKKIAIIGCGGVGIRIGTLLSQLLMYSTNVQIDLYDGDSFERRNADRQLVDCEGVNKATALRNHIETMKSNVQIIDVPLFFPLSFPFNIKYDVIFLAVDKKRPKREVFDKKEYLADKGLIVMAGNEYDYYQTTAFTDGQKAYEAYPDLLEADVEEISPCTGEITISEPQLVLFNQLAATTAVQLWWQYIVSDNELHKNCFEGNSFVNNNFQRG
jgi:hypothetical protein